jgi:hypothetical protein
VLSNGALTSPDDRVTMGECPAHRQKGETFFESLSQKAFTAKSFICRVTIRKRVAHGESNCQEKNSKNLHCNHKKQIKDESVIICKKKSRKGKSFLLSPKR